MGLQPCVSGNRVSYKRKGIPMRPSMVIETPDDVGLRRLDINVFSTYPYIYIYIYIYTGIPCCNIVQLVPIIHHGGLVQARHRVI